MYRIISTIRLEYNNQILVESGYNVMVSSFQISGAPGVKDKGAASCIINKQEIPRMANTMGKDDGRT